jgi:hypothetical protein
MPGCLARVSTDALCFVSGSGGSATLTVPVPLHPGLVGVVFHQQGIAFDPGVNAAGLTVCNSARVTIGGL